MDLVASLGTEGWKDVLQLLGEQRKKMEVLSRALSVIQQGMLRNNPGHVKDSVNEATEVLSGMLNTHKCLLESLIFDYVLAGLRLPFSSEGSFGQTMLFRPSDLRRKTSY